MDRVRAHRLAFEVATTLASTLAVEEALPHVALRVGEVFRASGCDVYVHASAGGTLVRAAAWRREPSETLQGQGESRSADRLLLDRTLGQKRLVQLRRDAPRLSAAVVAAMETCGIAAALIAPLVHDGVALGCLFLWWEKLPRRPTAIERRLLVTVAGSTATAMHTSRVYRQQERRAGRLAALLDSSRAVSSSVVLEDVLDIVARTAAAALRVTTCMIFEYDADRDGLVWRSLYRADGGSYGRDRLGTAYSFADFPADRIIMEGGVPVEERVSDVDLHPTTRAGMLEWGDKTCLNIPLVFGGQPMGILELSEQRFERRFSQGETGLARALGEQAAVAIRNAQLFRRQEEQNQRLMTLLAGSRALASSLDPQQVADAALSGLGRLLDADSVSVQISVDRDGEMVPLEEVFGGEATVADGLPVEAVARTRMDDLVRQALWAREPVQACDLKGRKRLVVPLAGEGGVRGLVDAQCDRPRSYSGEEIELIQVLANQIMVALDNARLYQTIERQATTDGLTGLTNHRRFYERLDEEVARSRRYRTPLSLLMIDVDDFKRFNDDFGHVVGDRVLRAVAGMLTNDLRRQIDVAARYGGEEFTVLLPGTSLTTRAPAGDATPSGPVGANKGQRPGALAVAERIRAAIAGAPLSDAEGKLPRRVTVSIGVAAFSESAGSAESLIEAADKALYLAKRLGKDRVERFR